MATTQTEQKEVKLVLDARGNMCLESEVDAVNAKYKAQEEELEKQLAEREKLEAKKNK